MTEFSESLTDPFGGPADPWMAGRTALVTGGGQQSENEPGVGYAICRVFAAHGARVAVLDRDLAAAQRTVDAIEADGGTAVAVVADLLDDEACRRAVEETVAAFGGFDTLVNNVAVGDRAGVFDVTPERFHQLMDLNLTTAWQMTRHAVEVLPAGSAIVNISSVGVRARGPAMVYNLAKAGAGEPHRRRGEHPRRPRHPGELRAGRRHLGGVRRRQHVRGDAGGAQGLVGAGHRGQSLGHRPGHALPLQRARPLGLRPDPVGGRRPEQPSRPASRPAAARRAGDDGAGDHDARGRPGGARMSGARTGSR